MSAVANVTNMDGLWELANGYITFKAEYKPNSVEIEKIEAQWTGNQLTKISKKLLDDVKPEWVKRDGNFLKMCQYTLCIIAERGTSGSEYLACLIEV